jgi:hypothetical protein
MFTNSKVGFPAPAISVKLHFVLSDFYMPQLDNYSIANQLFWGSLFFAFFYYLLVFVFIPVFFSSLYARKAFSAGRSAELTELATVIFAAQVLVTVSVEEIEGALFQLADQLIYTRALNLSVCESTFEFEFAQLIEDNEEQE